MPLMIWGNRVQLKLVIGQQGHEHGESCMTTPTPYTIPHTIDTRDIFSVSFRESASYFIRGDNFGSDFL